MKENVPGQPNVMIDSKGNVLLCGYLAGNAGNYYCKAKEVRLDGQLSPVQSSECPLSNLRSRACEDLKPIQNDVFSAEIEDASFR